MSDELLALDAGRPEETMTLVLHPESHPELVTLLWAAIRTGGTLKPINLMIQQAKFIEPPELNTWWNGDIIELKLTVEGLDITQ